MQPNGRGLSDSEADRILGRYQSGTASADETRRLADWMLARLQHQARRCGMRGADAEDLALEAFGRIWAALQDGRCRF